MFRRYNSEELNSENSFRCDRCCARFSKTSGYTIIVKENSTGTVCSENHFCSDCIEEALSQSTQVYDPDYI